MRERFREHARQHHAWHHWRPTSPLGRKARRTLRRRVFSWFLGGMFSTALVVSGAVWALSRTADNPWAMNLQRIQHWAGSQFERDFDSPQARDAFVFKTAEQLNAEVTLVDTNGSVLSTAGNCVSAGFKAPIIRDGVTLATALICPRNSGGRGWIFPVSAMIFLLMLWKVSGRIANRLTRPVDELTRVVKKLGDGELSARADLSCIDANEIGVVAVAVNDMAARIEKQMRDQRELLASVSHELRTPLARIRLISELGRDSGATAKTYDDLDREVAEVDALVGQLLASSRVEFGPLQRHALSAKDLGLRALERAGLDPAMLIVEGGPDEITGDATLLQRALANLLDNARKHGNGLESLTISLTRDTATFTVTDRGPGIAADSGAQLFESFQRGNGSEGLGLGLALVKRIAVVHGGSAWARNRDGAAGAIIGFEILTRAAAATTS